MKGLQIFAGSVLVLMLHSSGIAQQAPARVDPARSVTLSLAEYNRLVDLGDRPSAPPPPPPVPAVITGADLQVRVDGGTARGTFNLTGEVLLNGVAQVPLVASTALVNAISATGHAVPLVVSSGMHTGLLGGPGPFAVMLDWASPLVVGAGRASFTLPVPKAGTARVTLDVPGDQADVHVTPGVILGRSVANGRTLVDVALAPGAATSVWWSMRDSVQSTAARDVRAAADVFTLVTLGDSDVRMVALVDVAVLQGDLRTLSVKLPADYELASVSGSSIATSTPRDGAVLLTFGEAGARNHQFLLSLERPHAGGSYALESGLVMLPDVQRERGEIAVEGVGTLELTAEPRDGTHRIDVRELSSSLHALATLPLLSAFRYQRTSAAAPAIALDVKRFPDAGVLAAVADRASATTLVTSEGRALTEVRLQVRNRAQPFLKVTLPPGASMVSVDVGGASAKPVAGADGTRVPLLRPGFRPNGSYDVSFVYLHGGTPFARKGDMPMALPKMDMPVGIVEWEVFVPDRYSARAVAGNAIDMERFARTMSGRGPGSRSGLGPGYGGGTGGGAYRGASGISLPRVTVLDAAGSSPGEIRGRATDTRGDLLAGVSVTLTAGNAPRSVITGPDGTFAFKGVPTGAATLTATASGFNPESTSMAFDGRAREVQFTMGTAALKESITVVAQSPASATDRQATQPSVDVVNLQRRTSGLLPIRVDVPRAGVSHRFVKPLVIDQETTVTLRYKRR